MKRIVEVCDRCKKDDVSTSAVVFHVGKRPRAIAEECASELDIYESLDLCLDCCAALLQHCIVGMLDPAQKQFHNNIKNKHT